eukprot:7337340-Prymnesium_polylepis.1
MAGRRLASWGRSHHVRSSSSLTISSAPATHARATSHSQNTRLIDDPEAPQGARSVRHRPRAHPMHALQPPPPCVLSPDP